MRPEVQNPIGDQSMNKRPNDAQSEKQKREAIQTSLFWIRFQKLRFCHDASLPSRHRWPRAPTPIPRAASQARSGPTLCSGLL